MSRQWTQEQQMVLDERDNNLLVSAAAGSGKTAVMVERIIRLITEGENPPDIDRFLVVTFTRAAASSMREKIGRALTAALEKDPGNIHLQKQTALLPQAQITTVHGFCQDVIRSHFYELDMDPGFRVADEGEMALLRAEVLDELMELSHAQAEQDETIRAFFDRFVSRTGDEEAAKQVLNLYSYACAYPWPDAFRASLTELYSADDSDMLEKSAWMRVLKNEIRRMIVESIDQLSELIGWCHIPGGPEGYAGRLEEDLERFTRVLQAWDRAGSDSAEGEADTSGEARQSLAADSGGEPGVAQQSLAADSGDAPGVVRKERRDVSASVITYDEMCSLVRDALEWGKMAVCKGEIDPQLKAMVKDSRDELKKTWSDVQKRMLMYTSDQILEMNCRIRPSLQGLIALTDRFEQRFAAAKAERGCVDFSDLEHFALQILTDRDGNRTGAGEEYAATFQYVMTDEYQDSNLVQEAILQAVSGNGYGAANRFMVGDVKQSIYRFRQARPDLFIEKYKSYEKVTDPETIAQSAGKSHTIELHKNFRSRPQILNCVNRIFCQIMGADVGDVEYDEDAMLHPGAVFPPCDLLTECVQPENMQQTVPEMAEGEEAGAAVQEPDDIALHDLLIPELYLINTTANDTAEEEDAENNAQAQWQEPAAAPGTDPGEAFDALWERMDNCGKEALKIAASIRTMVGSFPVYDEESGGYRKASYGDIAVLYRGGTDWVNALEYTFSQMGIPSLSGAGGGYFDTIEVQTILSYLSVIDNPKQDIPLLGVLRSPIGGLTDEELARLRAAAPDTDLYGTLLQAAEQVSRDPGHDNGGHEKAARFLARLADMRSLVSSCSVHELIWRILDDTGYEAYVCAMPGGERRRANLQLLVRKAMDFEKGSYRGLFNFLRYINSLQKVSDSPEAVLADTGDAVVRIMTIHKSKGLEFPIVFVCGLGKKLGGSESSEPLLMHPVYGVGLDWKDTKRHIRMPGLQRQFIVNAQKKEEMGEELRILYVAMTRAKEKLILTGTVPQSSRIRQRWESTALRKGTMLPAQYRLTAGSFLSLLMPTVLRGNSGLKLTEFTQEQIRAEAKEAILGSAAAVTAQEPPMIPDTPQPETAGMFAGFRERLKLLAGQEAFARTLEGKPGLPVTVSVSELKHPAYEEEMRQVSYELYGQETPAVQDHTKDHANGKKSVSAAVSGSAWHTLMEHLDYEDPNIEEQLDRLIKCGKIDQFAAERIRLDAVRAFLGSVIGQRMRKAFLAGKLERETPFVIGRSARKIKPEWDSDELVLIQGIIDAWFEENGKIVLVDYKTDRVDPKADPDGQTLVRRYALQLDIYADALGSLTGKCVDEALIYSFSLGKTIAL